MTQYPTDLTEEQWQIIKNILEPQARNRKHSLKEIMNECRSIENQKRYYQLFQYGRKIFLRMVINVLTNVNSIFY